MYIIPDHYEMCGECDILYDSECQGEQRQSDNALLCDECASEYDFCSSCCRLVPLGTVERYYGCEKCRKIESGDVVK